MKKRTALFKVLKNRLTKFVHSSDFFFIGWATFIIVFAIIGFNIFKTEPIPLTQDEIEYYTSQAEIGYYKGIACLDDNIMFIPTSITTANVYTDGQPYEKQKLKITYFNKEIVNIEPYYNDPISANAISGAILGGIVGLTAFIVISIFLKWIIKKIITIRKEVKKELEKANCLYR